MKAIWTPLLLCLALGLGCTPTPEGDTGTTPDEDTATQPPTNASGLTGSAADPARWPRDFVAGQGTGPALYLSEDPGSPALGYITPGVAVRIAGLPQNGRIPIRIRGGLKVRAWMTMERLGLRVTERGKIGGTEVYVGPGDYVRFLSPAEQEGIARVEVMPTYALGVFGPAYTGEYPLDRLSADDPPEGAEAPAPGESFRLPAGTEVPLHSSPREVITTLPALEPGMRVDVMRDRGRWKGVRVGEGPYLLGYVDTEAHPLAEAGEASAPAEPPASEGPPARLRAEADKPLWRLAEGTRVRFNDTTVGILDAPGYGREMNRYEDSQEVDLFVAVDDDVALRGLVRISDLQPAE